MVMMVLLCRTKIKIILNFTTDYTDFHRLIFNSIQMVNLKESVSIRVIRGEKSKITSSPQSSAYQPTTCAPVRRKA
jgi:hypothetical protein